MYDVPDHKQVLSETSPLRPEGTKFRERADAEAALMERGATAVHLSGLCGEDRQVAPFLGYVKNGLDLVNLVRTC